MGTESKKSIKESTPPKVEKMGPLRGDGKELHFSYHKFLVMVEKMGPLRGDGNGRLEP